MPNIFDLEDELVRIAEAFDTLEGQDETPEVLAMVEAYFESLLDERDRKVDGYCRLIAEYAAKAKARKAEADRLAALAKGDQANADRLKARLRTFMEFHGVTRLEGDLHRVSLQANGGRLPLLVDEAMERNASAAPEWARHTVVTIDGDEVRKRLDAGETLEWARYGERGTQVRIR